MLNRFFITIVFGKPRTIDSIDDFIFYDIKVKRKEDLNRSDFEYDLIRLSEY